MAGGTASPSAPPWHKVVGITLALTSALFIGVSFVIKKKGLLNANTYSGNRPGEGHAYLKSVMWWTGMVMMLVGEICNMAAYAFSPAVLVTPLGALSVVISAILSSVILKERLSFSAKIGCFHCVLGATILVLHAPAGSSTTTLASFFDNVLTPGFLTWCGINVLVVCVLIFYLTPRWGLKHPIIPITVCSLVGAFVVLATQGLGSAIVFTVSNPADAPALLRDWRLYLLIGFIVLSGALQIHTLNVALNVFATAIVTPTYYVCFTTATLVGSAILFREFAVESAVAGATVGLAFLVIVGGVCLLFAFSRKERRREKLRSPSVPDLGLIEAGKREAEEDVESESGESTMMDDAVVRSQKDRVVSDTPPRLSLGGDAAGSWWTPR
ncbi:hypothetical protein SpCBS45565_g04180 [Spizellomyces sp. 'palustris']|nr:hypothetical protein SpCBS45565_g04180 [Spizellomyces sp. 'palustris']